MWSYGSWIYNYLCNQCLSLMLWVRISIRARCTTLCDKVCQWLATGRWFSPVSSINKTHVTFINLIKFFLKGTCIVNLLYWWRKPEYQPEKITDLPQVNDKLYHLMLTVVSNTGIPRHKRVSNLQHLWW